MGMAEQILGAQDLPPEAVDAIPEWGIAKGAVSQRGMTGEERRQWELLFSVDETGERPKGDPRATAVAFTLVDPSGKRVFSDKQIPLLAKKSGAVLDRLYDRAIRLSGIRATKAEAEAAQKNSAETGGSDSSTG